MIQIFFFYVVIFLHTVKLPWEYTSVCPVKFSSVDFPFKRTRHASFFQWKILTDTESNFQVSAFTELILESFYRWAGCNHQLKDNNLPIHFLVHIPFTQREQSILCSKIYIKNSHFVTLCLRCCNSSSCFLLFLEVVEY